MLRHDHPQRDGERDRRSQTDVNTHAHVGPRHLSSLRETQSTRMHSLNESGGVASWSKWDKSESSLTEPTLIGPRLRRCTTVQGRAADVDAGSHKQCDLNFAWRLNCDCNTLRRLEARAAAGTRVIDCSP